MEIEAWVVWANTDLTEGRGQEVPINVCRTEATARRLAHRASVQGSDGRVTQTTLHYVGGTWIGPVCLIEPNKADMDAERKLEIERARKARHELAICRAKDLGLSQEDIDVLRGAP